MAVQQLVVIFMLLKEEIAHALLLHHLEPEGHVIFILQLVDVVYHTDLFVDNEQSLHL